jgi:hypothetical protein
VRHRDIGQREPDDHEYQDGGKLGAFSKGADDQAASDGGESPLEDDESQLGDHHALGEGRAHRFRRDAFQEEFVQRSKECVALGKCRRVAIDHPKHGDQREDHEDLHQHRQHVLGTNQATVEQGQTRNRHQNDQCSTHHHPGVIALVRDQSRGCSRGSFFNGCRGRRCHLSDRRFRRCHFLFSPGRCAETDGTDQR